MRWGGGESLGGREKDWIGFGFDWIGFGLDWTGLVCMDCMEVAWHGTNGHVLQLRRPSATSPTLVGPTPDLSIGNTIKAEFQRKGLLRKLQSNTTGCRAWGGGLFGRCTVLVSAWAWQTTVDFCGAHATQTPKHIPPCSSAHTMLCYAML